MRDFWILFKKLLQRLQLRLPLFKQLSRLAQHALRSLYQSCGLSPSTLPPCFHTPAILFVLHRFPGCASKASPRLRQRGQPDAPCIAQLSRTRARGMVSASFILRPPTTESANIACRKREALLERCHQIRQCPPRCSGQATRQKFGRESAVEDDVGIPER